MGMKFLNKKSWHPATFRNQERVWKAEQKDKEEEKKMAELQKQVREEREREEFRELQIRAGVMPAQERLDFLYESGLGVGKPSMTAAAPSTEEYLLGKPAQEASKEQTAIVANKDTAQPGALFQKADDPASKNDAWRKLHSDPLLAIKQQEQAALAKIKENPIQMMMLKQQATQKKSQKKDEKKRAKEERRAERKRKREERKKRKRGSPSESESESESEGEKPKVEAKLSPPRREEDRVQHVERDSRQGNDRRLDSQAKERGDQHRQREEHRDSRHGEKSAYTDSERKRIRDWSPAERNGRNRSPVDRRRDERDRRDYMPDRERERRHGNNLPNRERVGRLGNSLPDRERDRRYGDRREHYQQRREERRRSPFSSREKRGRHHSPDDEKPENTNEERNGMEHKGDRRRRDPPENIGVTAGDKRRHDTPESEEDTKTLVKKESESVLVKQEERQVADLAAEENGLENKEGDSVKEEETEIVKVEHDDSDDEPGGLKGYGLIPGRGGLQLPAKRPGDDPPVPYKKPEEPAKATPRVKHVAGKLTEEEKARRLAEMQADADVHESQRYSRLKTAAEKEAQEDAAAKKATGKSYLGGLEKSAYGLDKGGTVEDSIRRRTHFREKGPASSSANAFRR